MKISELKLSKNHLPLPEGLQISNDYPICRILRQPLPVHILKSFLLLERAVNQHLDSSLLLSLYQLLPIKDPRQLHSQSFLQMASNMPTEVLGRSRLKIESLVEIPSRSQSEHILLWQRVLLYRRDSRLEPIQAELESIVCLKQDQVMVKNSSIRPSLVPLSRNTNYIRQRESRAKMCSPDSKKQSILQTSPKNAKGVFWSERQNSSLGANLNCTWQKAMIHGKRHQSSYQLLKSLPY